MRYIRGTVETWPLAVGYLDLSLCNGDVWRQGHVGVKYVWGIRGMHIAPRAKANFQTKGSSGC
jgi:hypothetical protein